MSRYYKDKCKWEETVANKIINDVRPQIVALTKRIMDSKEKVAITSTNWLYNGQYSWEIYDTAKHILCYQHILELSNEYQHAKFKLPAEDVIVFSVQEHEFYEPEKSYVRITQEYNLSDFHVTLPEKSCTMVVISAPILYSGYLYRGIMNIIYDTLSEYHASK